MYNHARDRYLIPTRHVSSDDTPDKVKGKYQGAFVMTPTPGLYRNVVPFDFNSLYPNTMITYNIDYSTYLTGDDVVERMERDEYHCIEWFACCGAHECVCASRGEKIVHRFRKSPKGVLPGLLDHLIEARKEAKQRMKATSNPVERMLLNMQQNSYKLSANSVYGGMGSTTSYLPFRVGAECTTAQGRLQFLNAQHILGSRFRARIVYGDTDSVYIQFPAYDSKSMDELWVHAQEVEQQLTGFFTGTTLKLAFEEKVYRNFYISNKKLYITETFIRGKTETKIDAKGMVMVRRDSCDFIRKLFEWIVHAAFEGSMSPQEIALGIYARLLHHLQRGLSLEDYVLTGNVNPAEDYKVKSLPTVPSKRHKVFENLGGHHLVNADTYRYYLIPPAAHVAYKSSQRGEYVAPHSRVPYVYIQSGLPTLPASARVEDPEYMKAHPGLYQLDYMHYVRRCMTPVDALCTNIYVDSPEWCKKPVETFLRIHETYQTWIQSIRR